MVKGLVLTALLVGVAGVARAQTARDATGFESSAGDTTVLEAEVRDTTARLDLSGAREFANPIGPRRPAQSWLAMPSFLVRPERFSAKPDAMPSTGGRKIDRRFVPIPLVGWRARSSLLTAHGAVAVHPSIVIGRRLTWLPEVVRGRRTLGVGVQVRVWLDDPRPTPSAVAPEAPASAGRILATVQGILDRR